ncbi:EAL domain-containing protein [Pengzhenrongella sp.]|jgi:diguanylate cyclase (GGDEF)-like protein/PAS domain S-box-containing protein|uniref:EAL domain-containing protein n=1 Tax=Pengzhenrongella sp. TaxID=2888820 RepID=UPI002F92B014
MTDPRTVLVLTPSIGGHYFGGLIAGLNREITSAGGRLVIVETIEAGAPFDEVGQPGDFALPIAWSQVDGVVSITTAARGSYLQQLRVAGKSVVLASTRILDFAAPIALPDNHGGTFTAVEHLIGHGHTRIGFVGNLGQPDVQDRYAAYLEALETHGLDADPALLFAAPDNSQAGGARAARDVLDSPDRPTALMVATDRNAIGLMSALTGADVAVPRDIAVVGFDNIEAGSFSAPTLTSVNQRFDEVGALAGRLVLAEMRGEKVPYAAFTSPSVVLSVRDSCGCSTDAPDDADAAREWSDATSPELLRDELQDVLCGALLTGPKMGEGPVRDAVIAVVDEAERLLSKGDDLTSADIASLVADIGALTPRPDTLRRITDAMTVYVRRIGAQRTPHAGGPIHAAAAPRVAAALWQLQAGAFLRQAETTETAIGEQYAVDAGLLDAGRSDPRHLGWLAGTHVRAGVLALWEDGHTGSRLRIVGTYDPDGRLPHLIGSPVRPERFPPAALISAARADDLGICVVVPVRTKERDWGLLAVVGEIDTTSARESYQHWAALLCASLESKRLQEAVRKSEERYALAARAANDGQWEWDASTEHVFLSDRCCTLLGLAPEARTGRLAQWQAVVHPEDLAEMRRGMRVVTTGQQETVDSQYRVRTAAGSYRWMLVRAISVRSPDGPVERVVGSLSDIHERRTLEDQLRENALYDALTGLPNRRLFLDRLDRSLALWQRSRTPFAVLFLDLDGFKAINDTLGHPMGDRLLNVVGTRIERALRTVDTGARFGGDEFAVLLHDVDADGALLVAQRVQAELGEIIDLDGHEVTIRASLGLVTSAIAYASAEEVLRDADAAMYHAKSTEKGTVAFFDAAMHARAMHHLRLHAEVAQALAEHQFEVHYQPIVDLTTGRADRFEALVRWAHPDRGLVPPDEFLPLMEEVGLIVPLGHWVIDEVCRQLAAWGPDVANVAINLSDREFWHQDLLGHVLASLRRHDLTAERLTLEITEGVILRRPEVALRLMRQMHDAGLRLHIDDFGTGYSSLATLQRFPVDAFKIDRTFIRNLTADARSAELVRVIVAMGNALGLAVVAEGIETDAQRTLLQEIGCTTGQGFLFTPAVRGEDAPDLLDQVLGNEPGHADLAVLPVP